MRKDYVHITMVLDRSGSMTNQQSDVIGGFNTFLEEQKKLSGKATMTLVQFNHEYEINTKGADLDHVAKLTTETYIPGGSTALLDAVGRAIDETGNYLKDMPESERPATILFVVYTDGEENASRERSYSQISDMIKHQTDKYNWQFMYQGANQDAWANSQSYGFGTTITIHGATLGSTYDVCTANGFYNNLYYTTAAARTMDTHQLSNVKNEGSN